MGGRGEEDGVAHEEMRSVHIMQQRIMVTDQS